MDYPDARGLYVEPYLVGPYEARFDLHTMDWPYSEQVLFRMGLGSLETLHNHLGMVIKALKERQAMDLATGPCDHCENARMSLEQTKPSGPKRLEHCPVCTPRRKAAEQRMEESNHAIAVGWVEEAGKMVP